LGATNKRLALLRELEWVMGNSFTALPGTKWGEFNEFEGDHTPARPAIRFVLASGEVLELHCERPDLEADELLTGTYVFGSSQFHIMQALDRMLDHLEERHGLRL